MCVCIRTETLQDETRQKKMNFHAKFEVKITGKVARFQQNIQPNFQKVFFCRIAAHSVRTLVHCPHRPRAVHRAVRLLQALIFEV